MARPTAPLVGALLLLACLFAAGSAVSGQLSHADLPGASPAVVGLLRELLAALEGGAQLEFGGSRAHSNLSHWAEAASAASASAGEALGRWGEQLWAALSQASASALQTSLTHAAPEQLLASLQQGAGQQSGGRGASQRPAAPLALGEQAVPGIMAVMHQAFFTEASAVALRLLQENFRKVRLDAVTTTAHVPVLGDFQLRLDNVRLEGLRLDQTRTGIALGTRGGFELRVTGLDAVVSGHLAWRRTQFPFVSGGCAVQVTAQGGEVRLEAVVVSDAAGRPFVRSVAAPRLAFASLAVVTSQARLAWLYNAVAALAQTPIQEAITREVAAQVTTTVPAQANRLLAGVPTTVAVKGLQLNTSLARSPAVARDRLTVWDWGRFQNPDGRWQECPFVRPARGAGGVQQPPGAPFMVVANLDESIANCLTWDLFRAGRLAHTFAAGDLPQRVLFTDAWRLVVPAVWRRCPGCPMALDASAAAAPRTAFHPQRGIVSSGVARLSFFLAESAGGQGRPWTPLRPGQRRLHSDGRQEGPSAPGDHLFTLSLTGELLVPELRLEPDAPARPAAWRLFLAMQVNKTALAVDVLRSDVGPINKASLHLAATIAAFLVEDQVNHGILADGFALPPTPHVLVTRANASVGDAVLALGSDLAYAG